MNNYHYSNITNIPCICNQNFLFWIYDGLLYNLNSAIVNKALSPLWYPVSLSEEALRK
jgi:hypothetical protein